MRLPTRLLRRKADSHKGDFGHIFIIAGSARFSGAAVLCAEAAMRSGAGLVTLGIPESINNSVIKIKPKEVMTLPLPETKDGTLGSASHKKIKEFCKSIDILALGPGLSRNRETLELTRKVISDIYRPLVVDADGLNALKGHLALLKKRRIKQRQAVLTPHPGEMARLLGISVSEVQKNRKNIAKKFADEYNVTIVLKGKNTVVAGEKDKIYVNKTGNPGMATAGSGDVLTGMIAAFLGQGLNSFEAAKYAVYLHGLAGDLAAKEKTRMSLIASDIIEYIPKAIKHCSY